MNVSGLMRSRSGNQCFPDSAACNRARTVETEVLYTRSWAGVVVAGLKLR